MYFMEFNIYETPFSDCKEILTYNIAIMSAPPIHNFLTKFYKNLIWQPWEIVMWGIKRMVIQFCVLLGLWKIWNIC